MEHAQNGGYVNPAPEKRQFRDPYGDWWDKQERRNFGEPVCSGCFPADSVWHESGANAWGQAHEDNDILGRFTPEEYTWTTPGKGFFQLGCAVAAIFSLMGAVYTFYPGRPAVPRTFPHGLEKALGGPGALSVLHPYASDQCLSMADFRF